MKNVKFTFSPHIAVQVKNYENAVRFFKEVLGFQYVTASQTEGSEPKESELEKDQHRFYVEDNPSLQTFFEFKTDNLSEAVKQLKAAGCTLKETRIPEGDISYLVYTPYGLNFHLWESEV